MVKMYTTATEKNFFALGTFNSIKAFDNIDEKVLDLAIGRVLEIDRKMSAFRNDSEISLLNVKAGKSLSKVGIDIFSVLKRAVEISKASGGAFDITMRPLVSLWGIGNNGNYIPERDKIDRLLELVDYNDIILDEKNSAAGLKRQGQSIDLGGIAKGYAADEVKRILLSCDVKNAMINLGGNIVAMGSRPDGTPWRIGIQNPLEQRGVFLGKLDVTDKTIVTSGSYERFFIQDGVRYHHILDPETGAPAQSSLLSITAVCDCSMDADALSTAFFVLGPQKGAKLFEKFGAEAIFVTDENKIYAVGPNAGRLILS